VVDDRRPDDVQPADDAADVETPAGSPSSRNIFAPPDELEQAAAREARKRAALWGFGTGLVMLVIVALCLVLAILAANSVD
jgi:hypothetical protein